MTDDREEREDRRKRFVAEEGDFEIIRPAPKRKKADKKSSSSTKKGNGQNRK